MRTRRSVRNQNILFKELFQPTKVMVEKARPAHLEMSDEQIDKTYFYFGKSDRTRMKKEAARERSRKLTQLAVDALPCGHNAGIEFGESSWSCVVCGQTVRH